MYGNWSKIGTDGGASLSRPLPFRVFFGLLLRFTVLHRMEFQILASGVEETRDTFEIIFTDLKSGASLCARKVLVNELKSNGSLKQLSNQVLRC